jgi:[ribosomal protein S18]-alanine N-acetyltransferase
MTQRLSLCDLRWAQVIITMMKPQIRRVTINDLNALIDIEQSCFFIGQIKRRQLRYLLTRAKAQVWGAFLDDVLVGYAIYLTPNVRRRARLYALAVLPAFRRQKVASSLLSHGQQLIASLGYQALALEVRCSNRAALALYQQNGFRWTHLLCEYYPDGEDGWKMVCPLPVPLWVESFNSTAA